MRRLLAAARRSPGKLALTDDGRTATYGDLLAASERIAAALLAVVGRRDLGGDRIAVLAEPSIDWVESVWGIWRAGGHAVPLALAHPEPELEHVLRDAEASAILVQPALADRTEALARRLGLATLVTSGATDSEAAWLPDPDPDRHALLLYTSGTTAEPKGVPLRHRHVEAQVDSLCQAWKWREDDRILGVLPLHHVHGIVNVLCCALASGAHATIHPGFDADRVWSSFEHDHLSLFMAVPTIYRRLIESWDRSDETTRQRRSHAASRLRLMVSGSAALPEPTLVRWREITCHTLLERYGMTEIGMALSQAYDRAEDRVPGTVGGPLPGVDLRLVPSQFGGQLEVRGPAVFDGYWHRPEATEDAFTQDGYFRTGDVVEAHDGVYRLLGRSCVDILKSGGEKVSALEIEAVLRRHDAVADAAVVGAPDDAWGQRVVAFVELRDGASVDAAELREWSKARLAGFKVPKEVRVVESLPRNALGKVVKGRL